MRINWTLPNICLIVYFWKVACLIVAFANVSWEGYGHLLIITITIYLITSGIIDIDIWFNVILWK